MVKINMGEILILEKQRFPVLVLSKEFFNDSGMIIACPIVKSASEDALHISICTKELSGIALLEQLKSLDINARHFKRSGQISYDQIQNISDAVQGIFDYYPFSVLHR